jgi:PAS domain S-box-containing protein
MEVNPSQMQVFRSVVESAPTAILVMDHAGKIVLINAQAEKYFGYRRNELIGEFIEILLPERFRRYHLAYRADFLLNPSTRPMGIGRELYGLRKDDTEFPIEIGLSPMTTDDSMLVLATVVDITERKRVDDKFRLAVEAAPNGIVMIDPAGKITLINSQIERDFGYSGAELIGQPVELLVPGRFRSGHPNLLQGFLQHPETRPMGSGRDLYAVRKDGTEFPVEVGLNPIETAEGLEVLAVIADITQRKQMEARQKGLEAQIQQTQKLESLGVLAGGIAHDFNNILTGVLGSADLALLTMSAASPARHLLENIQTSAIRAADLCRQMLAYSGKGKFIIEALDLNEVIEEMSQLLHISISKKAVFNYNLYPDLPAVEGDATQIRQVVMNLITNASEAIGDKSGVITVTTGAMECDIQYLAELFLAEELVPGFYVYLEVADTGSGMDKETQKKIFDPFFTTKFSGRGLGLAAVLGIVRSHHGAIKVYSEKDRGTTFKILFPCSPKAPLKSLEEALVIESLNGQQAVLIIDDEDTVRAVARQTLELAGLTVLTAPDGREGVKLFEAKKEEIALVLLDLTMPHLSGEEVYRKIRRLRRSVPVIIISGYNEQELSGRFAGKGVAGSMQKPLRPRELLKTVKQVLAPKD